MESQTIIVKKTTPRVIIYFGIAGENRRRQLVFDIAERIADLKEDPNVIMLLVKRPHNMGLAEYFLTAEDGLATWEIPGAELATPGFGELQIELKTPRGKVSKTLFSTHIKRSIDT